MAVDENRAVYRGEQTVDVAFGGGGSGAPTDAQYLTLALNGTLTAERRLVVSSPITGTDGGANGDYTVAFDQTVALNNNARVAVSKNGSAVGTRRGVNVIEGSGITLTVSDNGGSERVDITIAATAGGGGTVTSVDMTVPGIFTVSGNPITTSGTLAIALTAQVANTIWAGPTNGADAAPTFRAMVSADIPANIVTLNKIQQIATDRLLGRDTEGTGDVEQLTVGGGIEFTGSGGIQRSALTGDVTATAGSGTTAIANNAVTDAKIRDGGACSVIGRAANSSGDPGDISASTNDTVFCRTGNALVFSTVQTGMYADASVTLPKMANLASQRVIGRSTAGTGVPESITGSQVLDFIGSTRGSLPYRGASGWAALVPGTAGKVLTSNGSGADPSWESPSGPTSGTQVLTADDTNASGVLGAITSDLPIVCDADSWYRAKYLIAWQIDDATKGVVFSIHVGFANPPQTLLMKSSVPNAAGADVVRWQTDYTEAGAPGITFNTSGDIDASNQTRFAIVELLIHTHASSPGDIQLRYCGDAGATVTVKAGTVVEWTKTA